MLSILRNEWSDINIIDGVLSFVNNDGIKIHTHMQSYLLKVGSKVGLNSFIHDDSNLLTMV
jgi:hypothetical protein